MSKNKRYSKNPRGKEQFDFIHASKEEREKYAGHRRAVELSMTKAGKTRKLTMRSEK